MGKDKGLSSCSSSFDENKHLRDEEGKFTDKGTPAEQKRVAELTGENTQPQDLTSLLGQEYEGFKGQAAVTS